MKKIIITGLLTLVAMCASQNQASAWCNSRFGVGLNWNYASGGNSFLFGLIKNGQPGGADCIRSCVATPVYPAQGPCSPVPPAGPLCPPAAAPAVVAPPAAHGHHGHAGAATQSLRYPSYYRPTYPTAPTYQYPVNYYHGR